MSSDKKPKDRSPSTPEIDPAKWGQFEDALKRALSMPPHHHAPPAKPKTRPASKGRVHKGKAR